MKKALDNSCLKGCTVYLFILVVLVVVSMIGVSSLGSMFDSAKQVAQENVTSLTTSQQPATNAQPQQLEAAGTQSAQIGQQLQQIVPLLPTIAVTTEQIQQAAQTIEAGKNLLPTIQAQLPPEIASQIQTQVPMQIPAQVQPQAQPKSDGISGQATAPFYIVQSGDTLWLIADKFGTTVDALKTANGLSDNIIKPGQLLYLPQP